VSAPKAGDRVRVTYEATWQHSDDPIHHIPVKGCVEVDGGDTYLYGIPPTATVEVLASPAYVNHGGTEYRNGDVARFADGVVAVRQADSWYHAATADRYDIRQRPATLLVRDGEVVR
jgi:hypothetical protein